MRTRNPAIVIAIALSVGACSKSEPQFKPRPNTPKVAQQQLQTAAATSSTTESVEALKERLARQEAASRMFDAPKPAPAPVAKAEPQKVDLAPPPRVEPAPPVPTTAPTPTKPAPAPQKSEPVQVASSVPVPIPAAKPEAPAPQPRMDLAAAMPSTATSALTPRVLERVQPEFPREAMQAGADNGIVKARLTLDNGGNVTRVEVLESNPRRIFDRAVVRALSQWRFNDGPSGRTFDTDVIFKR